MITEAKNYIHTYVYREDGKGIVSYCAIDPTWSNYIKKNKKNSTFEENQEAIFKRIELRLIYFMI